MGDRCYMTIDCCRASDVDKLEDLFPEWETSPAGTAIMFKSEANYAYNIGCSDCPLPTDIPYTGHHTEGLEYGAGLFACDGKGKLVHVAAGHVGFDICFDEDGNPKPEDLAAARDFILFRKQVLSMINPQHTSTPCASTH